MNRIFVATSNFSVNSNQPLTLLEKHGLNINLNPLNCKLTTDDLIQYASDSSGIIAGTELYTPRVFEHLKDLKVISRLGVGIDNIDLDVAHENGVEVFRTKTTPASAVAELALGLMLDVARKVTYQHNQLASGTWKKEMGNLLQGKTLGIIGLGTIGKTLVELVRGFKFKVLAHDLSHDKAFQKENNITYCDLDTLLKQSDIISIHLNLTDKTQNLINEERIALMNPEAILINASRGGIVDEKALYNALKNERILGSGLDVFNKEPYDGPLIKLNNVVLTPHVGSYAKEMRIQMEIEAAENLIKGLQNE